MGTRWCLALGPACAAGGGGRAAAAGFQLHAPRPQGRDARYCSASASLPDPKNPRGSAKQRSGRRGRGPPPLLTAALTAAFRGPNRPRARQQTHRSSEHPAPRHSQRVRCGKCASTHRRSDLASKSSFAEVASALRTAAKACGERHVGSGVAGSRSVPRRAPQRLPITQHHLTSTRSAPAARRPMSEISARSNSSLLPLPLLGHSGPVTFKLRRLL